MSQYIRLYVKRLTAGEKQDDLINVVQDAIKYIAAVDDVIDIRSNGVSRASSPSRRRLISAAGDPLVIITIVLVAGALLKPIANSLAQAIKDAVGPNTNIILSYKQGDGNVLLSINQSEQAPSEKKEP